MRSKDFSLNLINLAFIMTFKIYTKTGDEGKTGLIGGQRVSKHHIRVECYGTVDELNSHIGLLRTLVTDHKANECIAEIQDRLFTLGAYLAAAPGNKMVLPELQDSDVILLENEIDRMTLNLPELKNFILPGGSSQGAQAHIARCVCRRAERLVVFLAENENIENRVIQYLNRLSDYLFVLARFLDMASGATEIAWQPRKK
jgi:cob(I)alamin adenosyltransferase